MVVADASFAAEHGDDLEHYILTLMAIANRVFSHPSLGSAISISVVKVLYFLSVTDAVLLIYSLEAQLTSRKFSIN